jgi:hypothetical protein
MLNTANDYFSENEERPLKFVILGILSPIFKRKAIELTTSRPRHFLGCHW